MACSASSTAVFSPTPAARVRVRSSSPNTHHSWLPLRFLLYRNIKFGGIRVLPINNNNNNMSSDFAYVSLLFEKYGGEECGINVFSFVVQTVENAVKTWHETSKVDPRYYFLLDNEQTDTEKYATAVNIDKEFESPHTHSNCFSFLRQYGVDSFPRAACLVTPKSIVSYPQMFKYKIAASDAHRALMKCPEQLENCSTGFEFSFQTEDAQIVLSAH